MGVLAFWFLSSLDHLWESQRFGTSPSFLSQPWCVSITHKLLHSCSALSGLRTKVSLRASAFFGCVFSPTIMVLANFRKTFAIDLSAMSSDLSRQDVVNILLDFFSHVTVKSIQFVPVKLAHVTFEDSATKDYYIRYDELEFNGVKCRVSGAGSQAQQVLVYHYPYAEDDDSLKSVLEDFGKVLGIRHQHYASHNAVSTGTCIVQMIRDQIIRRNLMVDGYCVKVWYVGQPLECDNCSRGHISRDCPMRGKCRHCGELGHLAHACKNPPRVWDVLTQNNDESSSSSASADPTPAEAVQISSGTGSSEEPSLSCSMISGVGAELVSGGLACSRGGRPFFTFCQRF